MKKLIYRIKLFFKRIKTKNKMIGKKVKLVKSNSVGMAISNNANIGSNETFIVTSLCDTSKSTGKSYYITDLNGGSRGWVYEHEIVGGYDIEYMEKEIQEMEEKISYLKSRIEWMKEVGVTEYDDDEFKVYETIKTLQNDNLSLKEKTKLITSLIKGSSC